MTTHPHNKSSLCFVVTTHPLDESSLWFAVITNPHDKPSLCFAVATHPHDKSSNCFDHQPQRPTTFKSQQLCLHGTYLHFKTNISWHLSPVLLTKGTFASNTTSLNSQRKIPSREKISTQFSRKHYILMPLQFLFVHCCFSVSFVILISCSQTTCSASWKASKQKKKKLYICF